VLNFAKRRGHRSCDAARRSSKKPWAKGLAPLLGRDAVCGSVTDDAWNSDFLACSYWMWPVRIAGHELSLRSSFPGNAELDDIYVRIASDEVPRLRFVQDDSKLPQRRRLRRPADQRYDGQIVTRHEVPTRGENWHDVLNALCFATFSRAKWALHSRQYRALKHLDPGVDQRWPSSRTREQDALTIFDEGGLVVAVADKAAYAELRQSRDMKQLNALTRAGQARVVPFGHAMLEHFVSGRGRPGGSARIVYVSAPLDADMLLTTEVDQLLATLIEDENEFCTPQEGFVRLVLSEAWEYPNVSYQSLSS